MLVDVEELLGTARSIGLLVVVNQIEIVSTNDGSLAASEMYCQLLRVGFDNVADAEAWSDG